MKNFIGAIFFAFGVLGMAQSYAALGPEPKVSGAAEAEQKSKEAAQKAEAEQKSKEAAEKAEAEQKSKEAAQKAEAEQKSKEAAQKAEAEQKSREAAQKAEAEQKSKEAAQKAEAEQKSKEAAQKAEADKKSREAAQKAEAEQKSKEAAKQAKEAAEKKSYSRFFDGSSKGNEEQYKMYKKTIERLRADLPSSCASPKKCSENMISRISQLRTNLKNQIKNKINYSSYGSSNISDLKKPTDPTKPRRSDSETKIAEDDGYDSYSNYNYPAEEKTKNKAQERVSAHFKEATQKYNEKKKQYEIELKKYEKDIEMVNKDQKLLQETVSMLEKLETTIKDAYKSDIFATQKIIYDHLGAAGQKNFRSNIHINDPAKVEIMENPPIQLQEKKSSTSKGKSNLLGDVFKGMTKQPQTQGYRSNAYTPSGTDKEAHFQLMAWDDDNNYNYSSSSRASSNGYSPSRKSYASYDENSAELQPLPEKAMKEALYNDDDILLFALDATEKGHNNCSERDRCKEQDKNRLEQISSSLNSKNTVRKKIVMIIDEIENTSNSDRRSFLKPENILKAFEDAKYDTKNLNIVNELMKEWETLKESIPSGRTTRRDPIVTNEKALKDKFRRKLEPKKLTQEEIEKQKKREESKAQKSNVMSSLVMGLFGGVIGGQVGQKAAPPAPPPPARPATPSYPSSRPYYGSPSNNPPRH